MSGDRAPRRVIVLGAASAMAEETCRLLAAEGASLCLVGRDTARLEAIARDLTQRGATGVHCIARDLADPIGIVADLQAGADALTGLDAVMLFYGILGDQGVSEKTLLEAQKVIEVNFASAALWSLASANLLERNGAEGGALLAVSSVAGDRGRRSNYIYGASKAGLSVLLQGIAHRFAAQERGLRAIVVKAGFVHTPMTAGIKKGGPLWATPQQMAKTIHRALDRRQTIVYAPWFWRWIMLLIRFMPEAIFKRLNI